MNKNVTKAGTSKPKTSRTRLKVQTYVSPELRQRIRAYCAANAITESAFMTAALTDSLEGKVTDVTILTQRLDRIARYLGQVDATTECLTEAFDVFMSLSFHSWTFPLPAASAEKATAMRAQVHQTVAERLRGTSRLVDRIRKDVGKPAPPAAKAIPGAAPVASPAPTPAAKSPVPGASPIAKSVATPAPKLPGV